MEQLIDRRHAGQRLAAELSRYSDRDDTVVLGIPRGGVVVAFEVANALGAPLDAAIVRKLGTPRQRELAFGAIADGGVRVLNDDVVEALGLTQSEVDAIAAREQVFLDHTERMYRLHAEPLELAGKTVVLVDDGVATGATMLAAVQFVKGRAPAPVVVAVPTGAAEICDALSGQVDEAICLLRPEPFYAIRFSYEDFSPVSDDDVAEMLESARSSRPAGSGHVAGAGAG